MEQMEEIKLETISKKEIKKYRHKAERRWYRRLVILNLIIVAAIIAWFISEINDNQTYFFELKDIAVQDFNETVEENGEATQEASTPSDESTDLDKKIEELPDSVTMLGFILGLVIAFPFILSYAYASYRSMSIKITEKNFPEIYSVVKEYADRLGMKKVPAVYLVQGNGILNAFSSCIPFRQYIELYADLVEVAYREYQDMDTLRFIIAHEISHIYLGHATLHYNYSILFSNMIPILSSTASRAREYSCDRIAQKLSGSDGIDAMMSLTAGIHLYRNVNREDYIENAKRVKGLFVWCYNIASSHPVTSKRVLALIMEEGSGKLY